jgi:hypothetical protein
LKPSLQSLAGNTLRQPDPAGGLDAGGPTVHI